MKTKTSLPKPDRKGGQFTAFRCPPELREHIQQIAKREHRTLSNAIVSLLYTSTALPHA